MNATTNPTVADQARRAGALAGLEALREFAGAIKASCNLEGAEFVVMRTKLCQGVAEKLGVVDPVHQGGVMALAEFIHSTIDGYQLALELQDWIPTAAMNEDAIAQEVARMESEIAAEKAEFA